LFAAEARLALGVLGAASDDFHPMYQALTCHAEDSAVMKVAEAAMPSLGVCFGDAVVRE
jgi:hypothetical protein